MTAGTPAPDYALVEELKQILDIPSEDGANDVDLQRALDAAHTWVDWFTGRNFGLVDTVRVYPAASDTAVPVVDLVSDDPTVEVDADGDRTFSQTLDPAQFFLSPSGGPPFDQVQAWDTPAGGLEPVAFWPGQLVRVTGTFGYVDARGQLPAAVNEANLLLGARYYKRREAPFQVLQNPGLDVFQRVGERDTDAVDLLFPFCLPGSPGAALLAAAAPAAGAPAGAASWVLV